MSTKAVSLFDREILLKAIADSFRKLNPRHQLKNPVMFVTLVGAILTSSSSSPRRSRSVTSADRTLASVHRAFLQTLLKPWQKDAARPGPGASRLPPANSSPSAAQGRRLSNRSMPRSCEKATLCAWSAGEQIPGDGDVVEGAASVERISHHRRISSGYPEAGGDRCAVTGGTRVLSDQLLISITADPGEGSSIT